MKGSHPTRFFINALFVLLCAQSALCAVEAPLSSNSVYLSNEVSTFEREWKAEAARVALESGLSAIAVDLLGALIGEGGSTVNDNPELALDYVAALIAQGSYEAAAAVLSDLPQGGEKARQRLYEACVLYGNSESPDFKMIGDKLTGLKPTSLRDADLPWYYLLQGIVEDAGGDANEAKAFFEMAESSATSPMQSALFSSLVLRQKMLTSSTGEGLLVDVREKFEALAGSSAAYPFLREYVILLHRAGRDADAITALQSELDDAGAGYSLDERASLLLLKGLILGLDSNAGWVALKELVRSGIDSDATVIALQLLGSVPGREADLMVLLNEIISRPEPHPLIAQLYYLRCQLALNNPETTAIAEADARYLLEQFPGFTEITSVYRLLVYAALQRNPPRYRVAADYLLGLRGQASEPEQVAYLNRLIGDCYFLNRDYANAVDFYEAANSAVDVEKDDASVFLRLVISLIRSGQYPAAIEKVDQADFAGKISGADRWRAEWSIALALQSVGEAQQALERLRELITREIANVPTTLDLRLRWLEAHISFQSGEISGLTDKIDSLLTRINTMPGDALGQEESSRLQSELLLLKSNTLIALVEVDSAFEIMRLVRAEYRNSSAAERSYFTEAAYHASIGDFASAQRVLEAYAEAYPRSTLVPQALYQAAWHCETRGPDHYGEAVVLLDKLIKNFQGNELAYRSGLKQGDLLRLMNKFAEAQLIYENLINDYPSHRLRYAAELSIADCMAALSQGDGDRMLEAIDILERLVDRPDLPAEVQIEAGYKWGSILQRNDDSDAAKIVYSLLASRYLLDAENASALTSVGRYWLSRTIFSLGDLLEVSGDSEEAGKLYRKLVAFNLPGRSLALSRIDQLRLVERP